MTGKVETNITAIEPVQTDSPVCGFWRRIAAFLIDYIILFMFGSFFGMLFFNQLAQLGSWGWLVGIFIVSLYFGVLNSSIGNGQSIGKKIFKIRVVNKDGELINLKKSFLRALFISLLICSDGIGFGASGLLEIAIKIFMVSLLVGLIYFYIFNRETRQALHDIVCDTYVYRADALHKPMMLTIPRMRYIVYAVILGVLCIGSQYAPSFPIVGELAALDPIYKEIRGLNGVSEAAVNINHFKNNGKETVRLKTTVYAFKKLDSEEGTRNQVARIILEKYPNVLDLQRLEIHIAYGYNIGIASGWTSTVSFMAPWEWKEKLQISKLPGEKELPQSITNTVAEKILNDIKLAYNRGDDKSLYNMMGDSTKNSVAYDQFEKAMSQIRKLGNIGNASYTHSTYVGNENGSDWFLLFYSVNYDAGIGTAHVTIKANNQGNWEIAGVRMNLK